MPKFEIGDMARVIGCEQPGHPLDVRAIGEIVEITSPYQEAINVHTKEVARVYAVRFLHYDPPPLSEPDHCYAFREEHLEPINGEYDGNVKVTWDDIPYFTPAEPVTIEEEENGP